MEERWGFLTPWCDALNKRLHYNPIEFEEDPRDVQKRRLMVTLPMRKLCSNEEDYRSKFQQVREALMLLSAVAHADQNGWKYLLMKYCEVDLGKAGGEKYEEEIPARFLLVLDLEERRSGESEEGVDSDIVEFCCVQQRETQSESFRVALEKITTLASSLRGDKLGMEVMIPVRVLYQARQPFSPMIADFANLAVHADMIETLSALVSDNVWFSRVTLYLRLDPKLKADQLLAKNKFGQLVSSVFDSTRRSPQLASTKYCSEGVSLQLGTVVVYCYNSLTSLEFEALCSAMVTNQTTKRLSLSLWLDPKDASSSALDGNGWPVVMSEHPEEELFGTSCGQINGRNAIFIQGATMCRSSDETGRALELELPTSSVRTFSDDGQSEWVDVVIPDHGRCLVRRNNLIFRPDPGENQGGISSLTIGFSDFNAQALDGLMNFLAAVGPSLRVLALDAMRIDFDVNFIIRCCPNLEELSLRSLVTDVRFDFKEWHESCQEVHDDARVNSSVAEMLRMLDENQTLEYLDVITPSEYRVFFDNFRGEYKDDGTFQIEFQNTREALALLAAVARVDYHAYKYLLTNHCGVDVGKIENFEDKIQVHFVLLMEHHAETDLVQLCGVAQRRAISEDISTRCRELQLWTAI
ncbi:Leucine-rich repeat domain, L domain-like [Phytophthora cactorum]|nr:Leucine-rich repeat domain, L domain-like [Phytophthora cactorum]